MSKIQEQVDAILHAVDVFRALGKNPKKIEALLDAAEILKRVDEISEYINPED